jgi:hypothetical protein
MLAGAPSLHTLTEFVEVSRPPSLAIVVVQYVGGEKVGKCHELCGFGGGGGGRRAAAWKEATQGKHVANV